MLPQELKGMGTDREIFFCERIEHLVMCNQIAYCKDRRFTSKLPPKVDIPALNV